jgi:class 3 adenylate cyclase
MNSTNKNVSSEVKETDPAIVSSLPSRYGKSLEASGLVDDVSDIMVLDPRPYRYTERDFVCRRGDAAESLWVIVSGSVAVREGSRTLFIRGKNEVVGEQNILGNGCRRWYDLVVSENQAELLEISKKNIESHPQADRIWRNIAKVISLKLKDASIQTLLLSKQLEDDTRILHAYTNEYALSRRLQSGGGHRTDHRVDRAIIWFSDVIDFSRYAKELVPTRTADIVQRFFNAQSIPIANHGGHIDKFIGDGLMAFWVLSEGEKPSSKCLETLRAAEEAVEAVSKIHVGKEPLHLRIGLHIGLVLSGDFGSTTRHQFTIIGPEVNKAARLEQIRPEDIVDGYSELGSVRISTELHDELRTSMKKKYGHLTRVKAKNIGEFELYS